MKTPAPADDASSTPARKRIKTRPAARRRTLENTYADPGLRERLKDEIRAASKGGEPGTWSARKSQLLTLAYQKAGGGYINRHPNSKEKDAKTRPKREGPTPTRRALRTPKKTADEVSEEEKKATSAKKKAGSKATERTVAAATALKKPRKKTE